MTKAQLADIAAGTLVLAIIMTFIALTVIVLAILPRDAEANPAPICNCDCDPGYDDPGDTFTALAIPYAKWSGRIIPKNPLTYAGLVTMEWRVNGTTIYSDVLAWNALTWKGPGSNKWQYENPSTKQNGGIRWIEFAPHNNGWRVAWQAYDPGFADVAEQTEIILTLDGRCYQFNTLWQARKSPAGMHMLGLK